MKLSRDLKILDVFCIGAGAMIAGLFILPGLAYAHCGPASIVSFLIAALLAVGGILSESELASAMPKAGGAYFYVTRSMGPALGTTYGITTFVSISLKCAFFLTMAGYFISRMAGWTAEWTAVAVAVFFCALFAVLNITGVKQVGALQRILFCIIAVVLVIYTVYGIPCVNVMRYTPFIKQGSGVTALFFTAGFVFVGFGAIIKVGSMAEEVAQPGSVIPKAMIWSIIVVAVFYLSVVFITQGVLESGELDGERMPLSAAAGIFLGSKGSIVLSAAGVLALLSAANAAIMSAARYLFAAARDGLLFEPMGRVHERFQTPFIAVIFAGCVAAGGIFLPITILVQAASAIFIMNYLFSFLSVIILRESGLQNYQPQFRSPLYPYMHIAGVIGFAGILLFLGANILILCGGLLIGGFFIYWFYGRVNSVREYALLHLIERVTARDHLTDRGLETELKDIIRERDEIVHDHFDHVIEESVIFDIDRRLDAEELFDMMCSRAAEDIDITTSALKNTLIDREKESSTAITSTVAIPHTVIEGEDIFKILIARCRKGTGFFTSDEVNAVFLIISSWDNRNFHLRALAAIAQIVQDPVFEKKWIKAKDEEALRDLILLGERRRYYH